MHKYWGYASLVAVTLWTFGVAAQTDLSELEDLANDCDKKPAWLSNKSQEVLYFAPMTRIELTEAERAQEKFGYEYATTTRRYPLASQAVGDSRPNVSLGSHNQSLWLVLDIPKPDVGENPPDYLWLVVSVPRDNMSFVAQFNGHRDFVDDTGGDKLQQDYKRAKRIKGSRKQDRTRKIDVLVFIKDDIPVGDNIFLGKFWWEMLDESYEDLVEPSRDNYDDEVQDEAYEHFFSYVKIKKGVRNRYPVIKSIRKKGKAFGLLLNNKHECLVSTTIEIVD